MGERNLVDISAWKCIDMKCEGVILQAVLNIILFMGNIGYIWSGSCQRFMLTMISCI